MLLFDPIDDSILLELLFDSNLSNREIAERLARPPSEVSQRIKQLGLGWVQRSRGHASRGQAALVSLMRKLLPNEEIVCEHPLGERLRLDVYCPKFKLAAEYHGRQHFEYVEFFHNDAQGYDEHYKRDLRKVELCQEKGIALVVFRYNDLLTEDVVFERLMEALATSLPVQAQAKPSLKDNPMYEAHKQRQREYRKKTYVRMKRQRGRIRE